LAELAPGTRIARWTIQRKLGQGGMGAVYEAFDPQLGRPVALKFMLTDDPELVKRFEREASVAIAMHDENVAATHACFPHAGRLVMVVELLPGGTLKDRVKKRGPLPWPEAARFGVGIARGLAAVHALGYVHRDLKPENVMLDALGTPKLTDFGLVRTSVGKGSIALTKTGEVVGTVEFMSPEQADGAKADARADLYSLGATLYYLTTGRPPFEGGQYQILKKVLVDTPPRPSSFAPQLPPALDDLIMKLLAKKPDARPASAEAVADALEALADTKAGAASRNRPWLYALLGLVGLGAGLGGYLAATRSRPLPSVAAPAPPAPVAELPAKKPVTPLKGTVPGPRVRAVVFAELEGELRLVYGGVDKTIHVLDPETGKDQITFRTPDNVRDLAVSGPSRRVFAGVSQGYTVILDLHGASCDSSVAHMHSGEVCVAISSDGKRGVSTGGSTQGAPADRSIIQWDLETKAPLGERLRADDAHNPWFIRYSRGPLPGTVVIGVDVAPPGKGGGRVGAVDLDPAGGSPRLVEAHHDKGATCAAFLRGPYEGAGWLASVGNDFELVLQDRTLAVVRDVPVASPDRFAAWRAERKELWAIEALSDGTLVTGDGDGLCQQWRFDGKTLAPTPCSFVAGARVCSLSVSPRGELLAVGTEEGVSWYDISAWSRAR
jgi:hypothetical protein